MSDTLIPEETETEVDEQEAMDAADEALSDVEADGHGTEPDGDLDDGPLYQLPEINGVIPTKLVGKLKAKKTDRLSRCPQRGERLVLVVEVLAGEIALNRKDELIQSLDVEDLWPLADDRAQDVLREVRTAWREAEDAALGRVELPFDETEAPTAFLNADGVVMTASELAEARGEWGLSQVAAGQLVEDARGLDLDPAGDTVTVEFKNGTKGLWPDDWTGSGQSLACVGGFMRLPGSKESEQVLRFRDVDGVLLDEWQEADEAARLGQLEVEVEARENAAAVAELEAGRGKGAKGRKR